MDPREVLRSLLEHRLLPLALSILAVSLASPSLGTGWQLDDLYHRWNLLGYPQRLGISWPPRELFTFLDGDASRTRHLMDLGFLPWWTLEDMRLAFWRPLAVLTHRTDYLLWPSSAAAMHAHSLIWFGAVVAAASAVYRRILGRSWVAGLAALFFAVDDAHGLPASWIANRNALLGTFFGLACLGAHHRWRTEGWKPGRVLSPLLLVLGLLGSEAALGVLAYIFAYELFLGRGPLTARAAALLPFAVAAGVWLAAYHAGGYGAWGSGYYLHPFFEPLAFLAAVAKRLPVLLLGQWAGPPSGVFIYLSGGGQRILTLAGLSFLVLLSLLLAPLLRHDRRARFWAAGMMLSLLPVCATFPHDRLLFFAGLGAMGLLALAAERIFQRVNLRTGALAAAVFLVHLVGATILLPLSAWLPSTMAPLVNDPALDLPGEGSLRGKDLVVVNSPGPFFTGYLPVVRLLENLEAPRLRVLAPGHSGMKIERADAHTLVVSPVEGYLSAPLDELFRGPSHALLKGETVRVEGMEASVIEVTGDGRPATVSFRFDVPLEHERLAWVLWEDGRYVPFSPPEPARPAELPAVNLSSGKRDDTMNVTP